MNHCIKTALKQNQLNRQLIKTSVGDVPVAYWLPENKNAPVVVAFHYQTGSKETWFEGDFDKLFCYAQASQSAFIVCDLYGHGEWQQAGFDTANISDEQWDHFVDSSVFGITEAIKSILEKCQITHNKLQFVASSTGCLIAVQVIKNGLKPVALVLSAPLPEKEFDDPTSFHNNLNCFTNMPLLMLTGEQDDEPCDGEVEWFFNLVDSAKKELVVYQSGHDLPAQWLDKTVQFLASV